MVRKSVRTPQGQYRLGCCTQGHCKLRALTGMERKCEPVGEAQKYIGRKSRQYSVKHTIKIFRHLSPITCKFRSMPKKVH